MAECDGPVTAALPDRRLPSSGADLLAGKAALSFLAILCGGAIGGMAYEAAGGTGSVLSVLEDRTIAIVRFTLVQAVLSTLLSVFPALAVARALARHPAFPGRALLLRLFAVPLALPAIVAALGVLALLGRAGLLADPLSAVSGQRWQGVYGLSGILIAHVFFNLPLAARLFLEALQTVPGDHWRLASQLGMGSRAQWRMIEWPALKSSIPGVAGLVFMLCVTSFVIVLTLGGGPAATTLEVAIYQSLRFDFDPARAVGLTMLQLILTGSIVAALAYSGGVLRASSDLSVVERRFSRPGPYETASNFTVISLAVLFVLGPIAAILFAGLKADFSRLAADSALWRATFTSLVLATAAAMLSTSLSLALVSTRQKLASRRRGNSKPTALENMSDAGASLVLVMPPIVIGAGWFVLVRHFVSVQTIAPLMVVCVNAAMAMPFVVRTIRPAHDAAAARHDRLAASLGISGPRRLRLIDWPVLRPSLAAGFAFAMALSLGDLGVIALFGTESVQTLPYLLLARLGSYRTEDAAGIALILALSTFALMILSDRLGNRQ